jgi:hypothetical protein
MGRFSLRVITIAVMWLGWTLEAGSAQNQIPIVTALKDPEAIAVLQQSFAAMGNSVPSDSIAMGNITIVAGTKSSQGTIRVLTRGTGQSSVQVTVPEGTRTLIYSTGQANELVGSTVNVLSLELAVTSQAPGFPSPIIATLLTDPDTSFQYVGLETSNGMSLHHISAWDSFASQKDMQLLANFSMRDIWIDAASGLVQRLSYTRRAAHGAAPGIAVNVFYSDYRSVSGVLYPYSIQESWNGTPWATITIQNVSLNNGLTDADFPIQLGD